MRAIQCDRNGAFQPLLNYLRSGERIFLNGKANKKVRGWKSSKKSRECISVKGKRFEIQYRSFSVRRRKASGKTTIRDIRCVFCLSFLTLSTRCFNVWVIGFFFGFMQFFDHKNVVQFFYLQIIRQEIIFTAKNAWKSHTFQVKSSSILLTNLLVFSRIFKCFVTVFKFKHIIKIR